jgi:hypothetical protein
MLAHFAAVCHQNIRRTNRGSAIDERSKDQICRYLNTRLRGGEAAAQAFAKALF